jgi:hypothetical protein
MNTGTNFFATVALRIASYSTRLKILKFKTTINTCNYKMKFIPRSNEVIFRALHLLMRHLTIMTNRKFKVKPHQLASQGKEKK